MKRFILIITFILSFYPYLSNAEQCSFRGIKLGQSLDENGLEICEYPKYDCDEMFENKKYVYKEWMAKHNLIEFRNLPDIGIDGSTITKLVENKIEFVQFTFDTSNFDEINKIMNIKYGKPKLVEKETVQNLLGAKFEKIILTWRIGSCEFILYNITDSIDSKLLHIETDTYKRINNNKNSKDLQKNINNF